MTQYKLDLFYHGLQQLDLHLEDDQISKFITTYEMLVETNKVMNLTAITDFDEVIVKHFLDSLSIVKLKPIRTLLSKDHAKVIDVGTGAGFPGIPLAIAFPNVQFTLADALLKRVRYLNTLTEALNLTNVENIQARAELLGRDSDYREQFDLAVSRAVANLSPLCEYCIPLVKPGGDFVAYKSQKAEEELNTSGRAISVLGGKVQETLKFNLTENDKEDAMERVLIDIKKVKNTPAFYPRKAGTPTKKPL
ncbi:MAG: 16S rRNA (guanine(527)-N(7))-methyltransferase RsmG [Eubacterium sp.]|nr:16S rRNA (guanine(527)-N(7))-methyltransferase RsmG [Eubacterium sp.]